MRKKTKHKKRMETAWQSFIRCVDFPENTAGKDESIEILGGNTVQVEGAKGIHTYEREVVKIRMKGYLIAIYGGEFELSQFFDGTLRVVGKLKNISWEAE